MVTLGLTWYFGWDTEGVTVLGQVESGSFTVKWPISWHELSSGKTNIRAVFSSAIVVAILGYFETMVGVKHLSTADNDVSKPNRELVALGAVNGVVCISHM
jgi:MFS superfamily sulfate permease-like transporter